MSHFHCCPPEEMFFRFGSRLFGVDTDFIAAGHYNQKPFLAKALSLIMESQSKAKRPTCPACSKPINFCLCLRIKTPGLENKVCITILQHSMEKKHPLNSTRIAKLGLKNVNVVTVSDVNFGAQFDIMLIGQNSMVGLCGMKEECSPSVCENACRRLESVEKLEVGECQRRGSSWANDFDSGSDYVGKLDPDQFPGAPEEESMGHVGYNGNSEALRYIDDRKNEALVKNVEPNAENLCVHPNGVFREPNVDTVRGGERHNEKRLLSIAIGKYGKVVSISHPWSMQSGHRRQKLEDVIVSPVAVKAMEDGFIVKKLQKRQHNGSLELEEFQEFDITIPPGSAVLFPAQNSVPIQGISFEVKNLIVLDGTWAKANRVYAENPWLKFLPCVKFDENKPSLYSEVRTQPKPGYLSTLESIVYALQELGESIEGLNHLLDVFESMIEDQRRCKNVRLCNASLSR